MPALTETLLEEINKIDEQLKINNNPLLRLKKEELLKQLLQLNENINYSSLLKG